MPTKSFKVASVTPGLGPDGMCGHLLIGKDGATFTARADSPHRRNLGDVLRVPVITKGKYDWRKFFLHNEKRLERTGPTEVAAIWETPEFGPHEKILEASKKPPGNTEKCK